MRFIDGILVLLCGALVYLSFLQRPSTQLAVAVVSCLCLKGFTYWVETKRAGKSELDLQKELDQLKMEVGQVSSKTNNLHLKLGFKS